MGIWQLQKAKARLSELIKKAAKEVPLKKAAQKARKSSYS
jgi:hypothetical protein